MKTRIKQQVTVAIANQPGSLAKVTGALARAKVNIEGISVAENTDMSVVRMVVGEPAAAEKALKKARVPFTVQDVAVMGLADKPGALAKAVAKLAKAGVNIDYIYGTACKCGCDCVCSLVLSACDLKKAKYTLSQVL